MNRIYQGRISSVEIPDSNAAGQPFVVLADWENKLWGHHVVFQDAVNYYIAAIASLGSSTDSPLTKLRDLLREVWDDASKKGQTREGMGASFKRAWQLDKPPTLDETIARFRQPLLDSGVSELAMELAGEALLYDLGGDGAIQQGGRTYFPMFCLSGFARGVTFPRSAEAIERKYVQDAMPQKLWSVGDEESAKTLQAELQQKHFCILDADGEKPDAKKKLEEALDTLFDNNAITSEARERFLKKLEGNIPELLPWKGTSVKEGALENRFFAFLVFKYLCGDNASDGVEILKEFYKQPRVANSAETEMGADEPEEQSEDQKIEARLLSCGDDPVRTVRNAAQIVFRAFSALPIWSGAPLTEIKTETVETGKIDKQGNKKTKKQKLEVERLPELHERSAYKNELSEQETHRIFWSEFDIAAFKEALKVWNQFKQNVEKREAKLDGLALKLLVMNGESALADYNAEGDARIHSRLERIWRKTDGKPKAPKSDSENNGVSIPSFGGDPRIERLRKIINDDLAEEYRLTEGRKTAYGLRRRTMKGWDTVKREWRKIVKSGKKFSPEKQKKLQEKLDELRGGEKREQIGSHKLFSALISDEEAWAIWREPTDGEQKQIEKNKWAEDPLEAFREYKETCDALDEISARPLRFTPADARFSRRLFMFTDVIGQSFGSPKGKYKHDMKALAVTVPVAVKNENGRFAVTTCRLVYSAPRLLRDRIRESDGKYEQDWTQPLVKALFGKNDAEEKINPQKLEDAAVALMPDFDNKGQRRFLLNFPLSLDEQKIKEKVGKAKIWYDKDDKGKVTVSQFMAWDKGQQLPYLLWESDITEKNKAPFRWWKKVSSFRVLGADLGTRHTASVAVFKCGKEKKDALSRFIGTAGGAEWFARFTSGTVLRLAGEDARVLRFASRLENEAGKAFREELYGERGRYPKPEEAAEYKAILTSLGQEKMFGDGSEKLSFPEQNDKLLVAIRRAQGWLANCVSWLWKLENPEGDTDEMKEKQRNGALEQIKEQDREPAWTERVKNGDLQGMRLVVRTSINEQRARIQRELLALTHRVLPLRGRNWEWVEHSDKKENGEPKYLNCHVLQQTQEGTRSEEVLLAGQRGLSIARIEQIGELRRRWQSLNQALRVEPGQRPKTASEMRAETIPDPCPDILEKLENIRRQRVDQTAHLILARALGLRLKAPTLTKEQRRATDTHGEYEKFDEPVDFIVLEDLNRYLTGQGRAKRENSRLMKWCHRAISAKLKMLAEPFGIPVLQTQAAYTSRFCSRGGITGFRAVEVGLKNKNDFRWRTALELAARENSANEAEREEYKKLSAEKKQEIAHIKKLFDELKKLEVSGRKNPTLLAPQPGGPIFVTAKAVSLDGKPLSPIQADINAAANIALRAIAAPDCADIHHRVRTERKKDEVLTREPRRFGKNQSKIAMRGGNTMPKEKNSNLFWDKEGVAPWGRASLENTDDTNKTEFPYASGPALWKTVNDWNFQWQRCLAINAERFRAWGLTPLQEWQSAEDDIPM